MTIAVIKIGADQRAFNPPKVYNFIFDFHKDSFNSVIMNFCFLIILYFMLSIVKPPNFR